MELRTEFLPEDFTEGDRVYRQQNNEFAVGTVRSVFYDPFGYLMVRIVLDNGEEFFPEPPYTGIGKILPLRLLEKGMVVSRWMKVSSEREYYTIEEYVPGEFLALQHSDKTLPLRIITAQSSRLELEKELMDWEIEE